MLVLVVEMACSGSVSNPAPLRSPVAEPRQQESDPDGDGVNAESDLCPCVPEDVDGYEDDDGCPDDDNDFDGVFDACDECPGEVGRYPSGAGCPRPNRVCLDCGHSPSYRVDFALNRSGRPEENDSLERWSNRLMGAEPGQHECVLGVARVPSSRWSQIEAALPENLRSAIQGDFLAIYYAPQSFGSWCDATDEHTREMAPEWTRVPELVATQVQVCTEARTATSVPGCTPGDLDGDGVSNADDLCIQVPGQMSTGCPNFDQDQDLVCDRDDVAPLDPGVPALRGRPRNDADCDMRPGLRAVLEFPPGSDNLTQATAEPTHMCWGGPVFTFFNERYGTVRRVIADGDLSSPRLAISRLEAVRANLRDRGAQIGEASFLIRANSESGANRVVVLTPMRPSERPTALDCAYHDEVAALRSTLGD